MLGLPEALLASSDPVSRNVAEAMALGALEKSGAFLAFSVTGLAGPAAIDKKSGLETPTGTVWIGSAGRDGKTPGGLWQSAKQFHFEGSRNEVRKAAALAVLEEVLNNIN